MPFCPGAARKGCLCRKAGPRVLSAHHPALSLLDIWLDLLLGLLGTEPSSLLPEPGVEHRLCVCVCLWTLKGWAQVLVLLLISSVMLGDAFTSLGFILLCCNKNTVEISPTEERFDVKTKGQNGFALRTC